MSQHKGSKGPKGRVRPTKNNTLYHRSPDGVVWADLPEAEKLNRLKQQAVKRATEQGR